MDSVLSGPSFPASTEKLVGLVLQTGQCSDPSPAMSCRCGELKATACAGDSLWEPGEDWLELRRPLLLAPY